jgi:hypothetical protein
MGILSRRLFLQTVLRAPNRVAAVSGPAEAAAIGPSSRRAFLQGTASAVGGAALILGAPKAASLATDATGGGVPSEPKGVVTQPSGPAPREPVTAYVRNPDRGEVTVMSGTHEVTYRDPALAKRLLDAAH